MQLKNMELVVQTWKPQGCWSRVGKQLAGKYPLDTSSSCGKSSDLLITVVICLWLAGWLVGWLLGCSVGLLIAQLVC